MSNSQLIDDFLELVQIDVQPKKEKAIAEVLRAKLAALDFEVEEDGTGARIGGECGNLIARRKGKSGPPAIMFSAHMDRVPNPGSIKPVIRLEEDRITSDGTTILGADDVSGICAILGGLRQIKEEGFEAGDLEVVFSIAEEIGLHGARHLEYDRLKSRIAYVLDCSGQVGVLVNQAPTQYILRVEIHGRSAHAGMEPEAGISALKTAALALSRLREGRLSPTGTANFGIISGGRATNIVPEFVALDGETRSLIPGEAEAYLQEMEEVFNRTAAETGARVEIKYHLEYPSFTVHEDDPCIQLALKAMETLGLKGEIKASGGGQDGNFFNSHGLKAVGLAPGYLQVHTSQEEQSISQLQRAADLVASIIRQAAEQC